MTRAVALALALLTTACSAAVASPVEELGEFCVAKMKEVHAADMKHLEEYAATCQRVVNETAVAYQKVIDEFTATCTCPATEEGPKGTRL